MNNFSFERLSQTKNLTTDDDNKALEKLESMLHGNVLPRIILSDFDDTLCHDSKNNSRTKVREPIIDKDVVLAAQAVAIILATARRVHHPNANIPWDSQLIPKSTPIIFENGGVIGMPSDSGIRGANLVDPEIVEVIHGLTDELPAFIGLPKGVDLVVKKGKTMALSFLADRQGQCLPQHNEWLEEAILEHPDSSGIDVVDSHGAVTLTAKDITKARAFRELLGAMGVQRSDLCLIGMGDGKNDISIFEEADISIAFGDKVKSYADIHIPCGPITAIKILEVIRDSGIAHPITINEETMDEAIAKHRRDIDENTVESMSLQSQRLQVTRKVGVNKALSGREAVDPAREAKQQDMIRKLAKDKGVPIELALGTQEITLRQVCKDHIRLRLTE